ncbi:MAG: helix-turn-helix transcriptional regulator [Synechococcales cyanobacterium C42_A2020_086]|nr:helix-turn-helix transcriptional regulator [Synechococcales cyanobacterium C42_A2020_086]
MELAATQPLECAYSPLLSSQNQGWDFISVEQFQNPSGEGETYYPNEHAICLSLAARPVRFLQIKGGKSHQSLYGKGDISITPAEMPFFARWQGDDHYLHIRIASQFVRRVAEEALALDPDSLELRPEFRTRDPQIESIGLLLLAELQQPQLGSRLYVESLANAFAVHLLRHYAVSPFRPPRAAGELLQHQLLQVLDFIQEHLEQEIKLADLAALVGVSPFHFSHLFKQTTGFSPYQYLLQQRIERAKQLLKQTNYSIMEIALLCGFNSHSHLSKQFRQRMGMSPKAYRDY